jgi:putative transposase
MWYLDEVFVKMGGRTNYLWRAVDAEGMMLDSLVQDWRNQEAAETFWRRMVEGYHVGSRVTVTDRLVGSSPAIKAVLPQTEHRQNKNPTIVCGKAILQSRGPGGAMHCRNSVRPEASAG